MLVTMNTTAHLTCVNATRDEIDAIADAYWKAGIRHIVALRGDPPGGIDGIFVSTPGGYAYANELVTGLLRLHPFEISVAAYPECHPKAPNAAFDLDALRRKIDAGATRAITNFFFETETYLVKDVPNFMQANFNAAIGNGFLFLPISAPNTRDETPRP